MNEARRVARDGGRDLNLPGRVSTELFAGGDGAACTVRRVRIPPTTEQERGFHVHRGCEEILYVLSGRGCVRTPGATLAVETGDAVRIPPDVPHFTVPLDGEIELLAFFPYPNIASITTEWDASG